MMWLLKFFGGWRAEYVQLLKQFDAQLARMLALDADVQQRGVDKTLQLWAEMKPQLVAIMDKAEALVEKRGDRSLAAAFDEHISRAADKGIAVREKWLRMRDGEVRAMYKFKRCE